MNININTKQLFLAFTGFMVFISIGHTQNRRIITDPDGGDFTSTTKYYYRDADQDGFGNKYKGLYANSQPYGYVTNSRDCDDTNRYITTAKYYYREADGDRYGDPSNRTYRCTQPSGYVSNNKDCNDSNSSLNSYTRWYLDRDGDGFGTGDDDPDYIIGNNNLLDYDMPTTYRGCSPPNTGVFYVRNNLIIIFYVNIYRFNSYDFIF